MSIQSRFRTYGLYKIGGKDDKGGINRTGTKIKDIEASISLITGTSYSQNSLFYAESTHTAIVNDKSIIFDKGSYIKDEYFTYQVVFANYNPDRYILLFLKQVI